MLRTERSLSVYGLGHRNEPAVSRLFNPVVKAPGGWIDCASLQRPGPRGHAGSAPESARLALPALHGVVRKRPSGKALALRSTFSPHGEQQIRSRRSDADRCNRRVEPRLKAARSETPFPDRVARVWGGLSEVVRGAEDPDAVAAAFFQVTPQQLRAWRASEGRHQCRGVTVRGHDCRNYASTRIDYDPRVWVSRGAAFCPAHTTPGDTTAANVSDRHNASTSAAPGYVTLEDDVSATGR